MASRKPVVYAGLGVLALSLVGLGLSAEVQPSDPEKQAAVSAPIPEEAKSRPNPQPATPESVASGRTIFSSQCTMCHGTRGDGKGDLVERLKLTVPDLTQDKQQSERTDGELFYILTHGHGRMQGEGDRLGEKVKWDLVNYIRSLPGAE